MGILIKMNIVFQYVNEMSRKNYSQNIILIFMKKRVQDVDVKLQID